MQVDKCLLRYFFILYFLCDASNVIRRNSYNTFFRPMRALHGWLLFPVFSWLPLFVFRSCICVVKLFSPLLLCPCLPGKFRESLRLFSCTSYHTSKCFLQQLLLNHVYTSRVILVLRTTLLMLTGPVRPRKEEFRPVFVP